MPILTQDMKRVVVEQGLGFVATVCPDGTPNLSPKGTTTVWDDDHLVFADLASPGTMVNLGKNAAVEVNVVDPITRLGYRFKGRARTYTEGPLFDEIVAFYEKERGIAPERIHGVAVVAVDHAAPLISPAYDTGLTRNEVARRSFRRFERVYGVRVLDADEGEPSRSSTVPARPRN